jgi:carbon monoxide dehydrogenase subunit G
VTTKVEKTVQVDVPVSVAYNQWTQFEEFPQFMGGVESVTQVTDRRMHWVAEIGGVKREWDADILEQVPDQKVAWAATEGATNAGAVYFESLGPNSTSVRLHLEYEPEGLVEKVGDKLNVIERQAEADLEKFKSFIESRGSETGGWRGSVAEGRSVGTPGVSEAAASLGDSGKAGVSGKAVAAGAAVAAGVAAAGVAAAKSRSGDSDTDSEELPQSEDVVVGEVYESPSTVAGTVDAPAVDFGQGPVAPSSDLGADSTTPVGSEYEPTTDDDDVRDTGRGA